MHTLNKWCQVSILDKMVTEERSDDNGHKTWCKKISGERAVVRTVSSRENSKVNRSPIDNIWKKIIQKKKAGRLGGGGQSGQSLEAIIRARLWILRSKTCKQDLEKNHFSGSKYLVHFPNVGICWHGAQPMQETGNGSRTPTLG